MVIIAASVELAGVLMGTASMEGQELGATALALPAFWAFLILLFLAAIFLRIGRFELLTRGELLCVLFAGLMAAPLISVGFWRFLLPAVATFPRGEDFNLMDTLNTKLWPHGPNLTDGILEKPSSPRMETRGEVRWENLDLADGQTVQVPVIMNTREEAESILRVSIPVRSGADDGLLLGNHYLFSVLDRAEGLALESYYFCRIYHDENSNFDLEVFTSINEPSPTFVQKEGFRRAGAYGIEIPMTLGKKLVVEFGLKGSGRVAFRDLQFVNVEAIESAYRGREVISEEDYMSLREEERAGLLVRPNNRFSLAGVGYLFSAYIHWKDWLRPLFYWGTYLVLILTGTFAVAVIMRRDWIESQRFPLPLAQIPLFFLGGGPGEGERDDVESTAISGETTAPGDAPSSRANAAGLLVSGWFNRAMWVGFAATFFWCTLRGWHDFNSNVPNLDIDVRLQPYFSDPTFGHMWSPVTFSVLATFLGLAVFMELNVLMSLIIGYFLYRAQYWFGEVYGLTFGSREGFQIGYPYAEHQQLTAYLVYAALLLVFSRKYLWGVFRGAVRGQRRRDDVLSSRGAILLLMISVVGMAGWAHGVGMPVAGILILFVTLLSVGFVAMKLRAECGVPSYAFFPIAVVLVVGIAGGMEVFGAEGTMFAVIVSAIIGAHAFFLIPGLQLEFLELSRIFRLKRRIVLLVNGLAVGGGFLIGGWFFLSGAYAKGIEWFPDNGDFRGISQERRHFNLLHTEVTRKMEEENAREEEKIDAGDVGLATWASLYAGGLTAAVAVLRYVFAGFWFHPVGIILGPMPVMDHIWGSLLVAWIVRFAALKLGGAATVREKLLPFFAGVFLAGVTAKAMFFVINLYLHSVAGGSVFQHGLF